MCASYRGLRRVKFVGSRLMRISRTLGFVVQVQRAFVRIVRCTVLCVAFLNARARLWIWRDVCQSSAAQHRVQQGCKRP